MEGNQEEKADANTSVVDGKQFNEEELELKLDDLLKSKALEEKQAQIKTTRQHLATSPPSKTRAQRTSELLGDRSGNSTDRQPRISGIAGRQYEVLKNSSLAKYIDFVQNEIVQRNNTAKGLFGLDTDVMYERPKHERSEDSNIAAEVLHGETPREQVKKVEKLPSNVRLEDIDDDNRAEDAAAGEDMTRLLKKDDMKSWEQLEAAANFRKPILTAAEKRAIQRASNVREQVSNEMNERFGFGMMQQDFQRAIHRDKKIIFGELTPEEIDALQAKRYERERKKALIEQEKREKAAMKLPCMSDTEEPTQDKGPLSDDEVGRDYVDLDPVKAQEKLTNKKNGLKSFGSLSSVGVTTPDATVTDRSAEAKRAARQKKLFPEKELNPFEVETAAVDNNIYMNDLKKENLTFDTIARSRVLRQIEKQAEKLNKYRKDHEAEKLNSLENRPWLDVQTQSERNLGEEVEKFLAEYEQMAKYKRLSEEEKLINQLREDGKEINTQARRQRRALRGAALTDEIPPEKLDDLERNYDERRERRDAAQALLDELIAEGYGASRQARKLRKLIKYHAERSSGSESSFNSESSRVNFWRDINTKDDQYKNAVIVSNAAKDGRRGSARKRYRNGGGGTSAGFSECPSTSTIDPRPARNTMGGPSRVQVIAIKTYEDQLRAMEAKMARQAKDFAQEKRLIKKAAVSYAITYYKGKSKDLTKLFTEEGLRMLEKYTHLRKQLLQRDDQLKMAATRTVIQESVIAELRQFIEEHLDPALRILEREDNTQIKASYINVGRTDKDDLDNKKDAERIGGEEGTARLGLFQSTVQQAPDKSELQKVRAQVREQDTTIRILTMQLNAAATAKDLVDGEKSVLQKQIAKLTLKIESLEKELKDTIDEFNGEIARIKMETSEREAQLARDREIIAKVCHYESVAYQSIIDKLTEEMEALAKSNRALKNVMRVPRLYEKFRQQLQQVEVEEVDNAMTRDKIVRTTVQKAKDGKFTENELATLSAALQLQFCNDYDVRIMRERILKNVHFEPAVKKTGEKHGIDQTFSNESFLQRTQSSEFEQFKQTLEGIMRNFEKKRYNVDLNHSMDARIEDLELRGPLFKNEHIIGKYQDDLCVQGQQAKRAVTSNNKMARNSKQTGTTRKNANEIPQMTLQQIDVLGSTISKGASEVTSPPNQNSSISQVRDVATIFSTQRDSITGGFGSIDTAHDKLASPLELRMANQRGSLDVGQSAHQRGAYLATQEHVASYRYKNIDDASLQLDMNTPGSGTGQRSQTAHETELNLSNTNTQQKQREGFNFPGMMAFDQSIMSNDEARGCYTMINAQRLKTPSELWHSQPRSSLEAYNDHKDPLRGHSAFMMDSGKHAPFLMSQHSKQSTNARLLTIQRELFNQAIKLQAQMTQVDNERISSAFSNIPTNTSPIGGSLNISKEELERTENLIGQIAVILHAVSKRKAVPVANSGNVSTASGKQVVFRGFSQNQQRRQLKTQERPGPRLKTPGMNLPIDESLQSLTNASPSPANKKLKPKLGAVRVRQSLVISPVNQPAGNNDQSNPTLSDLAPVQDVPSKAKTKINSPDLNRNQVQRPDLNVIINNRYVSLPFSKNTEPSQSNDYGTKGLSAWQRNTGRTDVFIEGSSIDHRSPCPSTVNQAEVRPIKQLKPMQITSRSPNLRKPSPARNFTVERGETNKDLMDIFQHKERMKNQEAHTKQLYKVNQQKPPMTNYDIFLNKTRDQYGRPINQNKMIHQRATLNKSVALNKKELNMSHRSPGINIPHRNTEKPLSVMNTTKHQVNKSIEFSQKSVFEQQKKAANRFVIKQSDNPIPESISSLETQNQENVRRKIELSSPIRSLMDVQKSIDVISAHQNQRLSSLHIQLSEYDLDETKQQNND